MKLFFLACILFIAGVQPLRATSVLGEVYYPCPDLRVVQTKYFEIVYNPGSADTAAVLSGYADQIYEEMAAVLKPSVRGKITVILTSDPKIENGFSSPVPYDHMVLVDTRLSFQLNDADYFRQLFTHELAHSLSLNVKSGLFQVLSFIFGNTMSPNLSVPGFMLEGVSVGFESLEGAGRVNDPAVIQEIRQDIVENRFKNPAQASGPFDRYPGDSVKYHYGGLFSDFLQNKYGMEKFADLWRANGAAFPYTLSFNFEAVYQTNFYDSWNEFREQMRPRFPVGTNITPAEGLSGRLFDAGSAALKNGKIYFTDEFDRDVKVYDIRRKTLETLLDGTGDLSVSPDGRRLAVTMANAESGVIGRVTKILDLERGCGTEREIPDLNQAVFFGDSLVATRSRNHKTDLVHISSNGTVRVLLSGTETLSFHQPAVLDGATIVLILVDNGERRIARLRMDTGELSVAEIPARYVRDLSVSSDGRILFSYNSDYSFYKAGILAADKLTLMTNNLTGGVFLPLLDGEELYYFGKFSAGHRLLKMNAPFSNRTDAGTKIVWKTFVPKMDDAAVFTNTLAALNPQPYSNFRYMLPHVWLPYATFGRNYIPDSLGVFTVLMDPVYQNTVTLTTTYNYYKIFQNVDLNWQNTSFPVHFELTGLDSLNYYVSLGYVRKTGASALFSTLHRSAPTWHTVLAGTGFRYSMVSTNTGEPSAYSWNYVYSQPVWTLYLQYSTAVKKYRFYDYKGVTVTAYYDYQPVTNIYKTEISLNWYPSIVPLTVRVSGAYSFWELFTLEGVSEVFGYTHYPTYREYAADRTLSSYYVSGEAAFPVLNWEIQQGIWLFPLYFNRFYVLSGYRAAYLAERYYQSVFARAELVTTPFYGGLVPTVTFWIEGHYAITSGEWNYAMNYSINY